MQWHFGVAASGVYPIGTRIWQMHLPSWNNQTDNSWAVLCCFQIWKRPSITAMLWQVHAQVLHCLPLGTVAGYFLAPTLCQSLFARPIQMVDYQHSVPVCDLQCEIWLKPCQLMREVWALFNPETSISIQKRHPYTGNLNSETSGDSKNAFLHCGDVSDDVQH